MYGDLTEAEYQLLLARLGRLRNDSDIDKLIRYIDFLRNEVGSRETELAHLRDRVAFGSQ